MSSPDKEKSVSLEVDTISASYKGVPAVHDLSFTIAPSKFLTLLGPSGCGKSTILRCVAGLHHIDSGEIRIGGVSVANGRLHVRPEHRQINMVFQSYAIWPHMSVEQNVGYGLRMRGERREHIKKQVDHFLELVGLSQFAERPATSLSGGQQQRVALARALATEPRILLLDEPLSNLDAVLRHRMRSEIMRIQKETQTTTLYVTHDCAEALSMSDQVIVMDRGRIAQAGAPVDLYRCPASRFVAEFLGQANVIAGTIEDIAETELAIRVPTLADAPRIIVRRRPGQAARVGDAVDLFVRPENLSVSGQAGGSGQRVRAEILEREYLGSRTEIKARSGDVVLKFETISYVALNPGDRVELVLHPDDIAWAPAS